MRGLTRTFGVSRTRVTKWLKKSPDNTALSTTLVTPRNPEAVQLELDEMWSFVARKGNKLWVWIALCNHTRQVVARVVGGRGVATCRKLWSSVPKLYKQGIVFSDFWDAYQAVLPDEQHQAVGKD